MVFILTGSVVNKDLTLKAKAKDLIIKAKAKDLSLDLKGQVQGLFTAFAATMASPGFDAGGTKKLRKNNLRVAHKTTTIFM